MASYTIHVHASKPSDGSDDTDAFGGPRTFPRQTVGLGAIQLTSEQLKARLSSAPAA